MNAHDLQSLATEWIAFWQAPEGSVEKDLLAWTSDREWELVRQAPSDAWQLVLAILAQDTSPGVRQALAGGPLEDLLSYHGDAVIADVEAEAGRNPRFAALLADVWAPALPDSIRARVEALRDGASR